MYKMCMLGCIIRYLEVQNDSNSQKNKFRGCVELLPIVVLQSVFSNSMQILNTFENKGSSDQNMVA